MPSGVSHGSALPLGCALATVSNPMAAKFGMRLIAAVLSQTDRSTLPLIMIRMLVADDAAQLVLAIVLQRSLARQVGNRDHPAEPGLGTVLPDRNQPIRAVEGAGHDLDARAVDAAEA